MLFYNNRKEENIMANLIDITKLTDGGLEDLLRIASGEQNIELTEGPKSNADYRAVSDLMMRRGAPRPSLHWSELYRKN
jgi:hypothetical protein